MSQLTEHQAWQWFVTILILSIVCAAGSWWDHANPFWGFLCGFFGFTFLFAMFGAFD